MFFGGFIVLLSFSYLFYLLLDHRTTQSKQVTIFINKSNSIIFKCIKINQPIKLSQLSNFISLWIKIKLLPFMFTKCKKLTNTHYQANPKYFLLLYTSFPLYLLNISNSAPPFFRISSSSFVQRSRASFVSI